MLQCGEDWGRGAGTKNKSCRRRGCVFLSWSMVYVDQRELRFGGESGRGDTMTTMAGGVVAWSCRRC